MEHIITVQRVDAEAEPIPHDNPVTVFRMHFNGRVIVHFEHGEKADRIAAAERAKALGIMAVFGD